MEYDYFAIENFKGIQSLRFELSQKPQAPIFLLVGLNESGKTTILEALSFFYDNVIKEKELTLRPSVTDDVHALIPKRLKDNFNGKILLKAGLSLSDSDVEAISQLFTSKNLEVLHIDKKPSVTMTLEFKDSNFTNTKKTTWSIDITYREGSDSPSKKLEGQDAIWAEAWNLFNQLIPPLIYYPNFLFNFPNKIFLTPLPDESTSNKEQSFYRRVIQDVLDSLENDLTIQTHIILRAQSAEQKDRDSLEAVISKMGAQLTKYILSREYSLFGGNQGSREIVVSSPRQDTPNPFYVELKLKEGQDNYYVSERSLGFKWFFTFLLFTQFRLSRQTKASNIYFLFDEPASNLHQSAQERLMSALGNLTSNNNAAIIYTTHSHHLINPNWLENAYIVRNEALDYTREEEFTALNTNITIEKYRVFVAKYPTKRNYYQPVLDMLEYRPSNLELVPDAVFVEGKNDFYSIAYMSQSFFPGYKLNICPGEGSGSLGTVIKLYVAWGRKFVAILDGDDAGRRSKAKYISDFGRILEGRVFTLEDVKAEWHDFELESLISKNDKLRIVQSSFPDQLRVSKQKLNLSIQELLMRKKELQLESETLDNFKTLFDFLTNQMVK